MCHVMKAIQEKKQVTLGFLLKKKKVLIQSLLAGIHLYFLKHLFLYFQLSLIPRQEIILPKMKNAT